MTRTLNFLQKIKAPLLKISKDTGRFKEAYPSIYKHGEIGKQMKDIVRFYKNKKPENVRRSYIRTSRILIISLQKRAKSFWKKCTKTA